MVSTDLDEAVEARAGPPGRRNKASTYPSALSGNPQQIMEDRRVCQAVVPRVTIG